VLGDDLTVREMTRRDGLEQEEGSRQTPTEGLVLDCSIVMAWFFADETSEYADDIARKLAEQRAFVPLNWPLEITNTLLVGERRNPLDAGSGRPPHQESVRPCRSPSTTRPTCMPGRTR